MGVLVAVAALGVAVAALDVCPLPQPDTTTTLSSNDALSTMRARRRRLFPMNVSQLSFGFPLASRFPKLPRHWEPGASQGLLARMLNLARFYNHLLTSNGAALRTELSICANATAPRLVPSRTEIGKEHARE